MQSVSDKTMHKYVGALGIANKSLIPNFHIKLILVYKNRVRKLFHGKEISYTGLIESLLVHMTGKKNIQLQSWLHLIQ